jgi:hypothetical protein
MPKLKPFRVSVSYIDWAHSSACEDGHDLAIRIMETPSQGGSVSPYILLDDVRLVAEVADCAELFVGGGETDLRAARVRKRAIAWLRERGLTVNEALGKKTPGQTPA